MFNTIVLFIIELNILIIPNFFIKSLVDDCFNVGTSDLVFHSSANPDYSRHMRALSIYAVLTFVTLSGLSMLWSTHLMSTWLLAVSGFSVEVVSKVVISLTLYALFLADAKFNEFWDKLDDYVYFVRLDIKSA